MKLWYNDKSYIRNRFNPYPMEEIMDTIIQKIDAKPGQRIIAMSDIHGQPDYILQLLRKLHYHGDDILVIVGDLAERGSDSLQAVRYIMDLHSKNQVYISAGNVDEHLVALLWDETDGWKQRFCDFVHWQHNVWHHGLILDMLTGLGISPEHITPENTASYRKRLQKHYAPEISFLRRLPTILDMGSYLFVHGGIPTDDLDRLAGTPRYQWLKNDRFLEQGHRFSRCVIVGHWPVCLYRPDERNMNPLFDYEHRIISIDGACGLKLTGQLNALVFPDKDAPMEEITWEAYDAFPLVTALESRKKKPFSLYIQYPDSQVEPLEEKNGMMLCRHPGSGKDLWIPSCYLYRREDGWHTDDYSDEELEVISGDTLSVLYSHASGCYVKKNGISGWYRGSYQKSPSPMPLLPGRPAEEKARRPRETAVYDLLDGLGIPYFHIDHPEAKTMKACEKIDEILNSFICKNLFLRNQQATCFYLLMMPADKKFKTKELSRQIGSARLSFAEPEYMETFLHISPGSVSVLGLMNDTENRVQLLMDRDVLNGTYFGCHPNVNTSSLRMKLEDLLERILPAIHHEAIIVDLKGE